MESPSLPPAPDPIATANAQSASNIKTATNQQQLNMVDQITPYGTLKYTQTGTWGSPTGSSTGTPLTREERLAKYGWDYNSPEALAATSDSSGTAGVNTPHFTSTQEFSPEQQKLYDLSSATKAELGQIGLDQTKKIGGILNTPFDLNSAIDTQLSDQATKYLDPMWKQRAQDAESNWLNRGIVPGMEAYSNMNRDFSDSRDRAYTQAALAGRGQAATEALTNRNQPLNEITALLTGSQVTQPSFVNTPTATVAPTDVAGITQSAYQNSLVPYNAENSYNNALMGGLFGMGGSALGGWGMGGGAKKLFGIG